MDKVNQVGIYDIWIAIEDGKPLHIGCGGTITVCKMGDGRRFLRCEACRVEVFTTILVTWMGSNGVLH